MSGVSEFEKIIGVNKPVIGMCHLRALPGDPGFPESPWNTMDNLVSQAKADFLALQNGGVDAVMFSNEFSLPYLTKVEPITIAAMARIIGELNSLIRIPFGVNVLWDPVASLDLAAVTGAVFIREIISGVYASDFGLWNTNNGETARHRKRVCPNVKMIFNIVPEASAYLGERTIEDIAKSTEFNGKPDVICVSGLTAGLVTDAQLIMRVKSVVKHTPVFCNTGVRSDNVETFLKLADGIIVGTTFKKDGVFENLVEERRVSEFMNIVRKARG